MPCRSRARRQPSTEASGASRAPKGPLRFASQARFPALEIGHHGRQEGRILIRAGTDAGRGATTEMTRCTLLLITTGESGRQALSEGMLLAERYIDALPMDLSIIESTPFAVAPATRIQERVSLPAPLEDATAAATAVGPLQAIWNGRRWLTPGSCPPGPRDRHGATEWQWAHYHAVLSAPADSIMLLWDIYVVPRGEELAA